jgi:hypothetical protein
MTHTPNAIDPTGAPPAGSNPRPRLGFLGVGWIGRHRMEAVARSGLAQVSAIADPDRALCEAARQAAPEARLYRSPADLLKAFYNSQRFTLNVTRQDMVASGYAPSVRLFEAAACGIPVISDYWPGLETFFTPGEEILIS